MDKIQDEIKERYEQYKNKDIKNDEEIFNIKVENIEEELQLLIFKHRYENIKRYVNFLSTYKNEKSKDDNIKEELSQEEKDTLVEYYLFDNDLKELSILGTSIYADVLFIKRQVPYLYRCVGKDRNENTCEANSVKKFPRKSHVKEIFKTCYDQFKNEYTGGKYSYSKCLGRVLFKYGNVNITRATYESDDEKKIILEIRKNAWVNSILGKDNPENKDSENDKIIMIQEYLKNNKNEEECTNIPMFCVDMSNAFLDNEKFLKNWIKSYLGKGEDKQEYAQPIYDVEVITNFTGFTGEKKGIMADEVERKYFCAAEYIQLLYWYSKMYYSKYKEKYSKKFEANKEFEDNIKKSIDSLRKLKVSKSREKEAHDKIVKVYEKIKELENKDKIEEVLNNVCWELEVEYMTRGSSKYDKETRQIKAYKEEDSYYLINAWKKILNNAIRGKYINFI